MENLTNIYVVTWKETEINADDITGTECGVCEEVFLNEDDARKKMWEMSDAQMDELFEVWDENEVARNYNGDTKTCDYVSVTSPIGTYEYSISLCYHT